MSAEPLFQIQRSDERGQANHGWLDTHHSFSFADYHDPQFMNWGALRVFNDDRIGPKRGFDMHPHRDMEILTYVLSGQLEHRDNMGHKGIVGPGGVQYMSAGTGVVHSEKNPADEELHLVQMWVIPDRTGHAPNYGQKDFTEKDRHDCLLLCASGEASKKESAPIRFHQDASFYVSHISTQEVAHPFAPDRLGFLFVASGAIAANGHALKSGDAVRMAGVRKLEMEGAGEIVLWDLPPLQ